MNARSDDEGRDGWQPGMSAGGRRRLRGDEIVGFAAVRVDGDGSGSEELIAPEDILYAFTWGAMAASPGGRRQPTIIAPWTAKFSFAKATVYFRTRHGVYRSYVRTLEEFMSKVRSARFYKVSQSVVANLPKAHSGGLVRQRPATLAYLIDECELGLTREHVVVGRNYLAWIRTCFGIPNRARSNS